MRLVSSGAYTLTPLPDAKPRNPGLHLGEIIGDWGAAIGKLPRRKPEESRGRFDNKTLARFEMGFAFECALETEFKRRQLLRLEANNRVMRQREIVEDDIWMTPDGLLLDAAEPAPILIESKLTWSAEPEYADNLLVEKWSWAIQTKCYARALRVDRVKFYVCWQLHYPNPMQYDFCYTQDEMDRAWESVLRHRDVMEKRNAKCR